MSIFDDLTKGDSFLSKKATNKQSGFSRKADAEVASDLSARKRDTEFGSDLSARKRDTELGSDFSARKRDTELGSDLSARKRDTELGSDFSAKSRSGDAEIASDFSAGKADTGIASDLDARMEDTELSSDLSSKNAKHSTDNISNTEFSSALDATDTEIASDMSPNNQYGTQTYSHAGVAFNKVSDGEAKINYAGLLSKDGAQQVIGIYGYGSNQNWENVSSVTLSKDYSGSFTASIPIVSGKNINFAFKDTAENWDNNSGLNYTFVN